MASPIQPESTHSGSAEKAPRILKLRIVPWDVIGTVTVLGMLLILVSVTSWPQRLFGFAENICVTDDCPPVPFGLNYYIYPLMWGGIGAAVTAAVIGPLVSMVKGWYMSFWPIIAIGVLIVTSVLGYALTGFSEQYWH